MLWRRRNEVQVPMLAAAQVALGKKRVSSRIINTAYATTGAHLGRILRYPVHHPARAQARQRVPRKVRRSKTPPRKNSTSFCIASPHFRVPSGVAATVSLSSGGADPGSVHSWGGYMFMTRRTSLAVLEIAKSMQSSLIRFDEQFAQMSKRNSSC
jgi:hypothetical protein